MCAYVCINSISVKTIPMIIKYFYVFYVILFHFVAKKLT